MELTDLPCAGTNSYSSRRGSNQIGPGSFLRTAMSRKQSFVFTMIVCVAVSAGGCSPSKDSTVTGRVTLDGSPVPRGSVAFEPVGGGMMARGFLNENGQYEMMTNQMRGLDPGTYRVKVLAREYSPPPPGGGLPPPGKLLVPRKYTSIKTSGLRYDVASGSNKIDIELVTK